MRAAVLAFCAGPRPSGPSRLRSDRPRPEEWLLIEWPEREAGPAKYWFSTLPGDIDFTSLVDITKLRWRIERDYLDLKQEIGLGHYEGRGWRGFHHHATLCIAAYAFLISERETNGCVAYAKAHNHPEFKDQTIWQVFEAERASLIAVPGRFDSFHAVMASVSKTCLVCFDRNKYSVSSQAAGRPVEVQAYADRIVIRQDGAIVGEHAGSFGRGQTIYDPWHYVPVLARKPGALRNGAPFKSWVLHHRWSA